MSDEQLIWTRVVFVHTPMTSAHSQFDEAAVVYVEYHR